MLFKKKKEEPHKGDVFLARGIYLREPKLKNGHVMLNCFLRSLIVFMLVFGSVGGFLSAFDLSYNYLMVIIAYLLLSTYFSFLYATSKMLYRDMGYIVFFVFFVWSIFVLRKQANSGFYEIVNRVLEYARNFFDLSAVREYEIQIDNSYFTIAVVAIFIGMVEIMVLNIWIYSTMSVGWTVLFTFPILFIPIYMKYNPDIFYIILLCAGYIAVVVFKANGHYLSFAWDASFRVKGFKKNHVSYTQDVGIFRQVIARVLVFSFCIVLAVQFIFPYNAFSGTFKNDRLREKTSDFFANFILLGYSSWFNRYAATGGLSGGKLGGVSNVYADNMPDLLVSFTPYGNQAIYLKGYTGGLYGDNEWESIYEMGKDDVAVFEEESLKKEVLQLRTEKVTGNKYGSYGYMDVKNVGANGAYLYYPYYTLFEDYGIYANHSYISDIQGLKPGGKTTYMYYPKIKWEEPMGDVIPADIDTENVNEVFLDVPEKNRDIIMAECEKIGLDENMTENQIAAKIINYFALNIPYTLRPGATPDGQDFINFFLTKNRKGYCAHFASAATLLFRQMGIPARYVEGYAFSMETVLASDLNEEKKYEDYYHGYSDIGESAVVDVEVTDAMAHAWVEIYIDGFGWKVVEVTPGSNEETEEDDFWSAFSDFLDNTGLDYNGNNGILGDLELGKFGKLFYVLIVIISVIIVIRLFGIIYRKVNRYRGCHQENEGEAVIYRYKDICDIIRMLDKEYDCRRNHGEQLLFIKEKYYADFDADKVGGLLERLSFSKSMPDHDELSELAKLLEAFKKAVWRQTTFMQKIKWLGR